MIVPHCAASATSARRIAIGIVSLYCQRSPGGHVSAPPSSVMNSRRFTAQCLPCFPTERIAHLGTADRCIHPPGRNEMIAITPPKIFSKEVAQNRPPHFPARTSSPPEIVSDQTSGDGAWMNFRFSRALPPGGLAHARPDDLEAFPPGLGHVASGATYLPTR